MSDERDGDADLGRSAGARAIDARAAIATAQLRSTVTSIGSALGFSSAHGERIVDSVDELVAEVVPELEAAEALHPGPCGTEGFPS
ncbi:hypothetical protein GCM10027289_25780 [Tsukamurella serpentis]